MIIFVVLYVYVMYNLSLNYSRTDIKKASLKVSEEGEWKEEARKVVVSEKEGNIVAFYGEVIMESVGSPEEEVKFNTLVPAPHIIPSLSSSSTLFTQVSNIAAREAK